MYGVLYKSVNPILNLFYTNILETCRMYRVRHQSGVIVKVCQSHLHLTSLKYVKGMELGS